MLNYVNIRLFLGMSHSKFLKINSIQTKNKIKNI